MDNEKLCDACDAELNPELVEPRDVERAAALRKAEAAVAEAYAAVGLLAAASIRDLRALVVEGRADEAAIEAAVDRMRADVQLSRVLSDASIDLAHRLLCHADGSPCNC